MELKRTDFSNDKVKIKFSKKKLFTLIKKRRNALKNLTSELNFLNDVFFDSNFNVDVNLKKNEMIIFKTEKLDEKNMKIEELNKEILNNILDNNSIKITLNKKFN